MASYKDNSTAMVIFAKAKHPDSVEIPNTINPDGTDMPFNPPQANTPDISEVSQNNGLSYGTIKKAVVGLGLWNALKSGVNYYKNNYGDIMQDSNKQAEINEAMTIIQMGMNIGMGFAVGGVWGGVASIISTGVSVGLQTASYQRMMSRNATQSEVAMVRTRYASINGGR